MKITSAIKSAITNAPEALAEKVRTSHDNRTIKSLRSKNLQFNTMASDMALKTVQARLAAGEYKTGAQMSADQKAEYIFHLKALNNR